MSFRDIKFHTNNYCHLQRDFVKINIQAIARLCSYFIITKMTIKENSRNVKFYHYVDMQTGKILTRWLSDLMHIIYLNSGNAFTNLKYFLIPIKCKAFRMV
jgi:hypothetical protein